MENITDIRVKKIFDIVLDYTNCLNSIKETFDSNYSILKDADITTKDKLTNFISRYKINTESITPQQSKELKPVIKKVRRAEQSAIIFPQSMLVSLVSQYDYLVGQLVQFIYSVNPNAINESGSQISYKELFAYSNLDAVREQFIQDKVETILRKSHEEQIEDLQKLSGVKNLKGVPFWKEFIEITQRRNLLVHCKGCVSEQYIQKCKDVGINQLPCKGDNLTVDENYFNKAYYIFYVMGVLLSQVVTRHLLRKENVLGEIDTILTHIIYESLEEEKYDLAIALSEFALEKSTKHSCRLDEVYFVLNYAQAYKWLGKQERCMEILSNFDFSAMTSDILVAKYALEDNIDKVVEHMKKTGNDSNIMTKTAYVSWVIFKSMREKQEFQETYKHIFGEDITLDLLTPEENKVVEEFKPSV
jgi:hypothetical protein